MTTDEARRLADRIESDPPHISREGEAATVLREQADEIDRLRATIAALLAVPDADGMDEKLWPIVGTIKRRMAAVVEGER